MSSQDTNPPTPDAAAEYVEEAPRYAAEAPSRGEIDRRTAEALGLLDDEDEFETDVQAPHPETPDPVGLMARRMVEAALAAAPGTEARGRVQGAIVVIRAPAGWERPVATAWSKLGRSLRRADEDHRAWASRTLNTRPHILCNDNVDPARPLLMDGEFRAALRRGRSIVVAPCGDSRIPAELLGAMDLNLVVRGPSPADLAAVAEAVASGRAAPVADSLAGRAEPDDLVICLRPGQSAEDYLVRVGRVVDARSAGKQSVQAGPGLDGLHGMDAAVEWGLGLARDLRAYAKGDLAWADVDRGALLAGPPGTGKTTFAKRLASECGVPLVATSYSEWQSAGKDGHLGELTKCIRARFAAAREAAPCIMFIDELDSVQSRGTDLRHQDWWTAVINTLLSEMDGVEGRDGVVIVGASNHASRVDPAILRSGRLDRVIRIGLPDRGALEAILEGYLRDNLPGADLAAAAAQGEGASGADVERWCRGARRRARHAGRGMLLTDLLTEIGEGREPRTPEYARRIAVHEAGHAVAMHVRRPGSVRSVSVRQVVGLMGGVLHEMLQGVAETREEMEGVIVEQLAGRAAEEAVLGSVSGGASQDLSRATYVAVMLEVNMGLGEGLVSYGPLGLDDVRTVLLSRPDVADRAEETLRSAYAGALALVRANRKAVDAVTSALLAKEVLDAKEVASLVDTALAAPPKTEPEVGRRVRVHDGEAVALKEFVR